jgi:hypothetical protein
MRLAQQSALRLGSFARERRPTASRRGARGRGGFWTRCQAVEELRRSRRGVVCHRSYIFKRAAVLEIGGDPRRSEVMVAELVSMPAAAARRRIVA